jgi:hypothetical protein
VITQTQAVTLTRRYQQRLIALATAAAARMSQLWDDQGSWNEADVDRFFALAAPLVAGAQRQGAALTAGYLGLMVGSPVRAADGAKFIEQIDLREPFLAYWAALARGDQWDQAITAGRTRSEDLALDGTNLAARGTATESETNEDRITGWERVPGGVCCEFCATVATQRYRTADSASFGHDRCNCAVIPIVGQLAPGRVINRPLLEQIKNNSDDDSTGFVNADGTPAPRPPAAPVEAP